MSIDEKVQKAKQIIKEQIEELNSIVKFAQIDVGVAQGRLRSWKTRAIALLSEQIHPNEGEKLKKARGPTVLPGDALLSLTFEANAYHALLLALEEDLDKHPKEILSPPTGTDISPSPIETPLRHMRQRPYYSIRTGKNPNAAALDLPMLLSLFRSVYEGFLEKGYFQEAFGYYCIDAGSVDGKLGSDIEAYMFRKLRKSNLWPIQDKLMDYSEDDVFDVIEFLYDYVSKPVGGYYHQYGDCGMHYDTFEQEGGRQEFRAEINDLLRDYKEGYELSEVGEILGLPGHGLEYLLQAQLPEYDPENVERLVNAAILKFRRYRSSLDDRRDAVRTLADVLEFLRPKLKKVLTRKDEGALFEIANKFAIRHHDEHQKTNYDKPIWYSWMFYFYLATVHTSLRLIKKYEKDGG